MFTVMLPCVIPWTVCVTTSSVAKGTIVRHSPRRRTHSWNLQALAAVSCSWMSPIFEIDLKVKGEGSSTSQDKVLCLDYFGYNNIAYHATCSYAKTKEVSTENCKMEFRFAHVKRSVEATISARIISGSGSFIARFTAHTTSITGEDVVLLDSQGREVAVAEDGEIELRRRVVVVAEQCELILCTETMPLGGGDAAENTSFLRKIPFYARSALRSRVYFDIGSIRIQIVVAWSL
ncbi:hypothetical protein HU200_019613 [Digitaria exilis]|uniref:DUF6598 domain-containing protein n=1 Tax=Digitaria exilis TaxID=1010633 RepID=A0A835KD99_9POAL|nr:hypothetical protein HU200_019613 [Digitaria exilis]